MCVCIHYESTSYKLYNKRTLKEGTFPFFRFFSPLPPHLCWLCELRLPSPFYSVLLSFSFSFRLYNFIFSSYSSANVTHTPHIIRYTLRAFLNNIKMFLPLIKMFFFIVCFNRFRFIVVARKYVAGFCLWFLCCRDVINIIGDHIFMIICEMFCAWGAWAIDKWENAIGKTSAFISFFCVYAWLLTIWCKCNF